ncbi:hypothetical protein StoSoilA2_11800 [Arthrobacter sp. StoSoilA2]|uniref:hypothetical protein n=1 Tax=Arthrobacter sp. StoSoilA2 TaxID=2830990 RepID=UPI001CC68597|nr:hypothetical protein [Arthrobacter sp. StoSoilA2]BCW35124.1 hypothetical protein StoSoilA2_11800 [Arthrobacter sp. StoSoilA2]
MGKYLKTLGLLPIPLRVARLTNFGAILVAILGLSAAPRAVPDVLRVAVPFAFGVVGLAAFFLGAILATDYRGSASAAARLGAVGPGSVLRAFLRLGGAGFMVVGTLFVAVSLAVAFVRSS